MKTQLPYKSQIMSRDIKPVNFISPTAKESQSKAKVLVNKKFLSAFDVVKIALLVVVIVNLWNHVSIRFH